MNPRTRVTLAGALLLAGLIGGTPASAVSLLGKPAPAPALHGRIVPLSEQPAADRKLGILVKYGSAKDVRAFAISDCTTYFPGHLCFWKGIFDGEMRVFNNSIISGGLSFYQTTWDNVTVSEINDANSTTYRVWTDIHCQPGYQYNGTLSPGASGYWQPPSVFFKTITGLTIGNDSGC